MKLAIVGAGWAGLSAAVRAADLGHQVTVFEASHTLGGRARAVISPHLQTRIDNGQHIMLGAYQDTMALMCRLEVDTNATLQKEALTLESADGTFRLHVPRLPAPFHLLTALLGAKGLFLRDKWRLLRTMRQLQTNDWHIKPDMTVQDWLDEQQQPTRVRALFWQPLCIAALNTPLTQASAQLFANVLRDSIGSTRSACDIVLPTVDLSSLWPDQVEQQCWSSGGSVTIRRGKVVTRLQLDPDLQHDSSGMALSGERPVTVNNEAFDAVIVACNVPSAHRLLKQLPALSGQHDAIQDLMDSLASFRYVPIATVTLQLATPWRLPRSMYQLHEDRAAKHFGQWLFNCPAFMKPCAQPVRDAGANQGARNSEPSLIHIVISDAVAALAEGEAALVRAIEAQLRMQTRRFGAMPAIIGHELIAEKRATFAAIPNLKRPTNDSPWRQVWLAGDWTDTGYPAVLEGAVRSGQDAAQALHHALKTV